MKVSRDFIIATVIAAVSLSCGRSEREPLVLVKTGAGDIIIEVYPQNAPVTVSNFLRYVDEGRFRTATFYRVVRADNQPDNDIKIDVIQGGIGFIESNLRLPPIAHETTQETGVRHTAGTVSMARAGPGTASSEFFICLHDEPELDFNGKRNLDGQGFAAFGRVVRGMDVVSAIHDMTADGQMLVVPVRILDIHRIDRFSKETVTTQSAGDGN